MLLADQIVLIKLTNGKKKLAQNTTLKMKVTATRKGTAFNVNRRFIYIKTVRQEPFDKKGSWQPVPSDRVCSILFVDRLATDENPIRTLWL